MSSPDSPSLEIERSARSQYAVVTAVLAILGVVPWCLPRVSLAAAALLVGSTCALASVSFWRIGWLGGARVLQKAVWASDGEWRIVDCAGKSWAATLDSGSHVMRGLVWLRFASEIGRREILLIGSGLTADTGRRLVARLRLEGARLQGEPAQLTDPGHATVAKGSP